MLCRYKKSHKKIAMGLLSFMPKERKLKKLQQTIQLYEETPDWQLYLWKKEEAFIGVIGVEVAEACFTVRHVSVNPSYQGEGIGHAMVESLQEMGQQRELRPTSETETFLNKCLSGGSK